MDITRFFDDPDACLGRSPMDPHIEAIFGALELVDDEDLDCAYAFLQEEGLELHFDPADDPRHQYLLSSLIVFVSEDAAHDANFDDDDEDLAQPQNYQAHIGPLPYDLKSGSSKAEVLERLGEPLQIREERAETVIGLLPGAFTYHTPGQNRFQVEFKGETVYRLVFSRQHETHSL